MILDFIRQRLAGGGPLALLKSDFRIDPGQPLGYYRPVVLYSFWADSGLARLLPQAFHLTNVLLHAANTALVCLAARHLLAGGGAALLAGALFAVHPVHVESVAFVSGRSDLWATLFALLATLPWLAARRGGSAPGTSRVALSSLAYALAALSKESALLLPAALLLWELCDPSPAAAGPRKRLKAAAPWLVGWAAAVLAVLWLRFGVAGIGLGVTGQIGSAAPGFSGASAKLAIWALYLKLLWFPWPLVPYYHFPEGLALGAATVAGAAATMLLAVLLSPRSRGRIGLLGAAWLAVFLLPVSGLVTLQGAQVAQRFLYLPSVGFCLMAGAALGALASRDTLRAFALPATAAALVLLAVVTARGATFWRDDLSFARQLTRMAPTYPHGYVNLGNALNRNGLGAEATAVFRDALARWPDDKYLLYNQGGVLMAQGEVAAAERSFRRATEVAPDYAPAWNNLGVALARLGRSDEAAEAFERALREDPSHPSARENLARLRRGAPSR